MISLPSGVVPVMRAVSPDQVLSGVVGRSITWEFRLTDQGGNALGLLDGVQPGGSVEWSASASVKGSGTITVTDVGQDVDWLNVRIQPVATFTVGGTPQPFGVWLAAKPDEDWTGLGRTWSVQLIDKASVLDQDVYTDSSGAVTSYTAPNGSNIIGLVRGQIAAVGESSAAISDDPATLSSDMTWDVGTTRLKIVNDLLDAGGFFSLYADRFGNFRADKYVRPQDRPVAYEALGPFTVDGSMMDPSWKRSRDIYSVPNRFVAITQGDGETAGLVGTATNTDPTSEFSQPARGRWITSVATGVEAVDQAAIDTYAARHLQSATSVATSFDFSHLTLPDLTFNSVVRVINPDANVDTLCTVGKTSVPFDLTTAKSTLGEVLSQ